MPKKLVHVKSRTGKTPNKTREKKITINKNNVYALKKKYPITFYKLNQMAGDPKKKSLVSRLPDYNGWLKRHSYDTEQWFKDRNKSKKDW